MTVKRNTPGDFLEFYRGGAGECHPTSLVGNCPVLVLVVVVFFVFLCVFSVCCHSFCCLRADWTNFLSGAGACSDAGWRARARALAFFRNDNEQ